MALLSVFRPLILIFLVLCSLPCFVATTRANSEPLSKSAAAFQGDYTRSRQRLAQFCGFGWGVCPSGGCAPLGSVCCGNGYCSAGQTCCGTRCCHPGSVCTRFGCVPTGALDCGSNWCPAGTECSSGGGCRPAGSDDCGNGRHCRPGYKCAIGGGCLPQDAVDCGNGRSCDAGNVCVDSGCMTQTEIDQQAARRERDAREEEARVEEARRQRELEKEAARRERDAREEEARVEEARRQRELEERKTKELRELNASLDGCRRYLVASCDTALASPLLTDQDRTTITAYRETALKFENDTRACQQGSAAACNEALASPPITDSSRQELLRWRNEASVIYQALAYLDRAWEFSVSHARQVESEIRRLPTSTIVVGAIAAMLAVLLALVSRRNRLGSSKSDDAKSTSWLMKYSSKSDPQVNREQAADPLGGLAPAVDPVIEAEKLSVQTGPPQIPPDNPLIEAEMLPEQPGPPQPPQEKAIGNYKLGQLLVQAGTAGIMLSVVWWLVFYMRVNEFMGGKASDMRHALRCLFSSSGPCGFIQGIANAGGAFAYEPLALWISVGVFLGGLMLRNASTNK